MHSESDKKHLFAGLIVFTLLAISWIWGLKFAPEEEHMGEVYRIIYLHVPVAFTAFFSSFVLSDCGLRSTAIKAR